MTQEILPPEPSSTGSKSSPGGGPTQPPVRGELHSLTLIVYILQGVGLLLPITFIVGVIINYIKKEDTEGTIYDSHFRWQIRTFWWGMIWAGIGLALLIILVGKAILIADVIWLIYRIIKGFLFLQERRAMPVD